MERQPANLAKQRHASYLVNGTHASSHWSQIIRSYLSQNSLKEAILVYTHSLPSRAHQSMLPLILKACASLSLPWLGKSLHGESVKSGSVHDLLVGTTLVSMYCKCRETNCARKVFDEMSERNVVTNNAMIGGYSMSGDMDSALVLFNQLPARTPVSWAEMIDGFGRIGNTVAARRLFDQVPLGLRTVVTWTVMVQSYTINCEMNCAKELFDRMPVKNFFVWSSMITGYFKNGEVGEARAVFDRMPERNLVNWNALIAGYAQHGCCEQALDGFRQMQENGCEPDEFTVVSVLSACAQIGSLEWGKEIHELINQRRIRKNLYVMNGLIDMYAKCGDLEGASRIFGAMSQRNDSCWNAMITGLGNHGQSKEALELFAQMEESDEKPNAVTFLAVLSACTHGGFVEEGMNNFAKMNRYGLVPGIEHYGCLIDLLSRAGRLSEAYDMVKKMPMTPNEVVWGALLGACRVCMDTQMANQVVRDLGGSNSSPGSRNDADYVVLSNIYASSEKWEAAERMRREMVQKGIHKIPGCSSVIV